MKPYRAYPLFLFLLTLTFPAVNSALAKEKGGKAIKTIIVNVDRQKLFAWEGNKLVYEFDVVTGRPGKETTAGIFRVFRKHEEYTSQTYNVPMPYSMFFTKDGKAIHGTQWAMVRSYLHAYLTESVGSQGCVGLAEEDAKALFEWAPMNQRVVILDEEPDEDEDETEDS